MATPTLIDILYGDMLAPGVASYARLQLIYEYDVGKLGILTAGRMRLLQLLELNHATD